MKFLDYFKSESSECCGKLQHWPFSSPMTGISSKPFWEGKQLWGKTDQRELKIYYVECNFLFIEQHWPWQLIDHWSNPKWAILLEIYTPLYELVFAFILPTKNKINVWKLIFEIPVLVCNPECKETQIIMPNWFFFSSQ